MRLESKSELLKNGEAILIREANVGDAAEIITTIKEYVEESEYIPYVQGEFNPTVADEEKWIQSILDSENSLLLLAIHKDRIIGNISLNGSPRKILNHTACIGIGLLKEFRGLGLGSILFDTIINWAKGNPVLEYLWLETYNTNKVGLAIYQKYGFLEVGRDLNFVKLSENKYVDNVRMYLNVKNNN